MTTELFNVTLRSSLPGDSNEATFQQATGVRLPDGDFWYQGTSSGLYDWLISIDVNPYRECRCGCGELYVNISDAWEIDNPTHFSDVDGVLDEPFFIGD